jgi:hypothetical protein
MTSAVKREFTYKVLTRENANPKTQKDLSTFREHAHPRVQEMPTRFFVDLVHFPRRGTRTDGPKRHCRMRRHVTSTRLYVRALLATMGYENQN